MKLTKKELIKAITPGLESLGYVWFKDSISGFQGLYIKDVGSGLYMTLGLTISRYENEFTGDFYYSTTTNIGCVWGDIPLECYKRPGFLMTDEELSPYRDEGSLKKDIWWDGSDVNSVGDFIRIVKMVEPRLINNKILKEEILKSVSVNLLNSQSEKVRNIVSSIPNAAYRFTPEKPIDGIPLDWFKASECVLVKEDAFINKYAVKRLASDAYRQHVMQEYRNQLL